MVKPHQDVGRGSLKKVHDQLGQGADGAADEEGPKISHVHPSLDD